MAEESPTRVSNDELVESCLMLVQQLFAENKINDQERDYLKGKQIRSTSCKGESVTTRQTNTRSRYQLFSWVFF